MKYCRILAPLIAAAALLASVAPANASYTITKHQAEINARDAAETKYGDQYGIRFGSTSAVCKPQFIQYEPGFTYHRWICGWAGPDAAGDVASGVFRITGHSGNSYGYLVLRGINWS